MILQIYDNVIVICVSLLGILSISAAMQGYFIRKNKFYESLILLVVGIMFIMQNYITNLIVSPYNDVMFSELDSYVSSF